MQSTSTRNQKLFKTGAALLSIQGITWITTLVGVLVVPRFLGPSEFGLLTTGMTAATIIGVFAVFGSTNYLIKETARAPIETYGLVFNVLYVRAGLWLGLNLVLLPFLILMAPSAAFFVVFVASGLTSLTLLLTDGLMAGFQGNQRLGKVALVASSVGLLGQAGTVFAAISTREAVGVSLAGLAATSAGLVTVAITFVFAFSGRMRPSRAAIRGILVAGPSYFAWDLGLAIYARVDLLILPTLAGTAVAGAYAFAYRLVSIPVFATTIITMAIYPALSTAAMEDAAWFRRVVTNAARLAFSVTAPMAAGLAVLSVPIVQLLSGDEFGRSAVLVVILAIHIPPAAVHTVLGVSLFARDHQKRMAAVAWGAVVFNVALNLITIPLANRIWDDGALGSAFTSVATEVFVGSFVWWWAWPTIDTNRLATGLARISVATLVMAGAAALANVAIGLFGAIAIGAATYVVAALVFGVFSPNDLQRLRRVLLGSDGLPPATSVEA
ncbi:MAG: oligosaccharide flippase family protein [Dehalococcoidia bacterium]